MHRGIDNHKVRGDNEHGPQAAGVRVRSVPAAIGSQHALARCQQTARDFVAADSQKFQAAAEGDRGRFCTGTREHTLVQYGCTSRT
jgi:hypothetical protein